MRTSDRRGHAPAEWTAYWAAVPNAVDALYATVRLKVCPFVSREIRIEAWGQLCFDRAAANAVAYHMYNNGMRTGWKFVKWRCEMSGPLVGGAKLSGLAPPDFDPVRYVESRR